MWILTYDIFDETRSGYLVKSKIEGLKLIWKLWINGYRPRMMTTYSAFHKKGYKSRIVWSN